MSTVMPGFYHSMFIPTLVRIICYALSFNLAAASSPLTSNVHVRTPSRLSEDDVNQAIRREIGLAAVENQDRDYIVNATLDRSWNDATLLSLYVEHDSPLTFIEHELTLDIQRNDATTP